MGAGKLENSCWKRFNDTNEENTELGRSQYNLCNVQSFLFRKKSGALNYCGSPDTVRKKLQDLEYPR